MGHRMQPPDCRCAAVFGATCAGVRQADARLLRSLPRYALLQGEVLVRFKTRSGGSRIVRQSNANFPSRSRRPDLDVAGKSGEFDFPHPRILFVNGQCADLREELRPAYLIPSH
jgi:hypothetical protein